MKSESSALARELHELSERLRVLESKLTSPATELAGGQYYLDGQPVSMEVLSEFKSSLDHSRDSVWALLDVAAGYSGHTIEETLQNHRMQSLFDCMSGVASRYVQQCPYRVPAVVQGRLELGKHFHRDGLAVQVVLATGQLCRGRCQFAFQDPQPLGELMQFPCQRATLAFHRSFLAVYRTKASKASTGGLKAA